MIRILHTTDHLTELNWVCLLTTLKVNKCNKYMNKKVASEPNKSPVGANCQDINYVSAD